MRLSIEDYRRGILFWDIPDTSLRVTSATLTDRDGWSEGIVSASGSVAPVPRRQFQRLQVMSRRADGVAQRPYQIRWESLGPGDTYIMTRLWNDVGAPPTLLPFVPNLGSFHRLVVSTPFLAWPAEAIFREGDVVVRLVDGEITGEHVGDISTVATSARRLEVESERTGTVVASGRFIEITAPGSTPEHAEHAASAILGYLAACLGDHAVGNVVFSEAYAATHAQVELAVRLPTIGLAPWPVETTSLDALEQGFAPAVAAAAENRAVALALRWYQQGVRVESPLDKLLAFFIGIEAVVSEFASRNRPLPVVQDRQVQYAELLNDLTGRLDPATLNRIRSGLVEPSIMDRFRFYAERRRLEDEITQTFRVLRDLRNDVFHGATVTVTTERAGDARRLLVTLLRTELSVTARLPWDESPRLSDATLVYTLAPRRAEPQ